MYGVLADLVVAVHAAYVVFVVGGELAVLAGWLLGWGWTRNRVFRLLHLAAIALVVVEVLTGTLCPLTVLENHLRRLAGGEGYELSFIGYWLDRVLFYRAPGWVFTLAYASFGLLVALTFWRYPPGRRT